MAKQRLINTKTWDEEWFTELNIIEKLLFLYFLTNPLTDISGGYEISIKRMVFDTGIERDEVLKTLEKFGEAKKVFYRDGWIFVENFIKHQAQSPKILAGIRNSLKNCPDWIKDRVSISYPTVLIPYQYGINTPSHSNTNTNSNININTPPTPSGTKSSNGNGDKAVIRVGVENASGSRHKPNKIKTYAKKYKLGQGWIVNALKGNYDDVIEDEGLQQEIESCLGCKRHKYNALLIPPCPKHGNENFEDWKTNTIERKKKECIDCQRHSKNPEFSPKCERHSGKTLNQNFQSWVEDNLKNAGLNSTDYFSCDLKTASFDNRSQYEPIDRFLSAN